MIPALPCISRCIEHYIYIVLYTSKVSTKTKKQTKSNILLSLHRTTHSKFMLHVECSNYLWTTNKQQAPSSSTPLKKKQEFTHTHTSNHPHTCTHISEKVIGLLFKKPVWRMKHQKIDQSWSPKSWNIVETKGPRRRVQEQQGNVRWPGKLLAFGCEAV